MKAVIVVLAAFVIESINFFFLFFPLDVGLPPNSPWYIQVIGFQWVVLHFPGLYFLDWFEKIFGCNRLNAVMGCRRVDSVVIFVGGYLATVLLAFAVTYGFQWILRLQRKLATRPVPLAD